MRCSFPALSAAWRLAVLRSWAPVYIAEVSPAPRRGRLVGLFQINIVVGILLAYFSNYCIARMGLGNDEWRWQLGIAAHQLFFFCSCCLESPQSALARHQGPPRRSATRFGNDRFPLSRHGAPGNCGIDRSGEIAGFGTRFSYKYRYPIFLAITIGMFNQLSGINAILYYLNDIFAAAGFSKVSGELQAVAVGCMNLAATLFAMTLIDKLGRKTLLLIGSVGTAVCLGGVSFIFFTNRHQDYLLWLLLLYIGFFAISQGAVIWVYLSEVFPTRVRAKGQSLGSSTHWIMNGLISGAFPLWANSSGGFPFLFFAAMMALQFVVVLYLYPETKQITLERLQARLGIE